MISAMLPANQEYVLATGNAGAQRLALLHTTYGESTEALLDEVGLSPGMRAVDLGCGTGTVSRWMASRVGAAGEVIGVDVSDAQLEVARAEALRDNLGQARFQQASVYDTGLARERFDLAYCRFLLCHIGEPERALREMRALIKPGGFVVCEDVDLASFCSDPPSAGLLRMRDIMVALGESRGVDYCLGPRLHRVFRRVGFDRPFVRMQQPAHDRGEAKRFWEYTFLEASPAMIQAGLTDAVEVKALAEEMAKVAVDPTTIVAQACKIQVWARK
jgi:ubiquinone/menaquinone biosynthesis C-methylase UbiE